MFVPSVQLVNVNPTAGTALTVTDSPESNVPPPVVVPLNNGLDESPTLNVGTLAVKLAVTFLSEFMITVAVLDVPVTSPLQEVKV